MNQLTEAALTIATAIIGVTILAVLVARKSNTAGVIQSLASAFGNTLTVAVSPVTENYAKANLSYPSSSVVGGFPSLS